MRIHLFIWQVELWKKYIQFEKSNPLRSEDTALVTRRVMFATEQCLLVLNHHPAVWHQAAQYLDQSSKLLTEKGVRKPIYLYLMQLKCDTIAAVSSALNDFPVINVILCGFGLFIDCILFDTNKNQWQETAFTIMTNTCRAVRKKQPKFNCVVSFISFE